MTLLAVPSDHSALDLRAFFTLSRQPTAAQAGYAASGVIALGILLAIITTPDPLWWQLHFSQLGTFAVFSGFVFNGTIVISGAMVVYFATRLRAEMVCHSGTEVLANRRAATIIPFLVGVIGVHLSMVGIFPLNVNEFMHDRGPQGALLAFIFILGSRRWVLRGMHTDVAKMTRRVGGSLVVTIPCFATGVLNLAAFELIVFSLMFLWFLMLARNIGRPSAAETETETATAAAEPRRARARRPRRHVGLHAAPPRPVHAAATHPGVPATSRPTRTLVQPRQRARTRRSPSRSYAAKADSDHHHPGT